MKRLATGLLTLALACLPLACGPVGPSPAHGATGEVLTIQNKGSDTLVNLALAWAEAYTEQHPQVRISVAVELMELDSDSPTDVA